VDAASSPAQSRDSARAWGSLLSTQDFAAITGVGFEPVGHVLGAGMVHLGYVSRGGKCSGTTSYTPRTDLATAGSGPFNTLLRKRYGARHQALARAVEECQALGGDGIVGMRLSIRPFPAGGTEFSVQGTAVRARSASRPAAPFSSHLSAQELARLVRSGLVPTALVFGISLGARHDDMRTRRQRRWRVTDEVRGYSGLVKDTRREARDQLRKAVTAQGTDGRAPLTILHLNPSRAVTADLRPDSAAGPSPPPDPGGGFLDRFASSWAARRVARSTLSYSDSAGITRRVD
jgi:uncharacterized protein YbjQ (UPF0145 family)